MRIKTCQKLLIYSVCYFNLGAFNFFGDLNPSKPCRGDGTDNNVEQSRQRQPTARMPHPAHQAIFNGTQELQGLHITFVMMHTTEDI